VHEADDPDAFLGLFDSNALIGKPWTGIRACSGCRYGLMRLAGRRHREGEIIVEGVRRAKSAQTHDGESIRRLSMSPPPHLSNRRLGHWRGQVALLPA
jgi:hypothetical protein